MDQLIAQIGGLSFEDPVLKHDAGVIVECYERQCELAFEALWIRSGMYASIQELYRSLLRYLPSVELIEMMPLIDEYLEYYENNT